MTTPLLEVKGLKKYFPIYKGLFRKEIGVIKAVDGIDFSIPQGHVLGMVGESGCGKSTAARAAIRLIEPTAGSIDFMGQSLSSMSKSELKSIRKDIQMVFQDPYASLNPRKTIRENIGEALLYHHLVTTYDEQRDRVADVLQKIGLSPDVMERYPHEFSGGQQQRICIGRAISLNPKLIVCDEAVSSLDVSIQAQILNLLLELKETLNLSYLFISHDLAVIRHLADHVAVLYYGKIVENRPTEELFEDPQNEYTKTLLASIPRMHPSERRRAKY
jgi:ABC-type oligopeptide transport system ATPase subunit